MAEQQAQIELYHSPLCPYCHFAKRLLNQYGWQYEAINITFSGAKRDEMIRRAKQTSVPQIFINQQPIGGYDQLAALDKRGELAQLVAQPPSNTQPKE